MQSPSSVRFIKFGVMKLKVKFVGRIKALYIQYNNITLPKSNARELE